MGAAAVPLAIGGAVVQGALSAKAASDQNRAIKRSMDSQNKAAGATQTQLLRRLAVERAKIKGETNLIRGRIRVLAAERGVAGGSVLALQRQADYDEAVNDQILQLNYNNQIARVQSGLEANMLELEARGRSSILAALSGGAQGFGTGLSIDSAFTRTSAPEPSSYDPSLVSGGVPGGDIYDYAGGAYG